MNTYTRGEKIDMAINTAKAWIVRITIVAWAILTIAIGISLGIERVNNENLREQIKVLKEEQKSILSDDVEAVYVYRK